MEIFDVVFSHLVGVAKIITATKVVVTVTLAVAKFIGSKKK